MEGGLYQESEIYALATDSLKVYVNELCQINKNTSKLKGTSIQEKKTLRKKTLKRMPSIE